MGKKNESSAEFPLRIQAAFAYLDVVQHLTVQWDAGIPAKTLTPLQKSVETIALRALQQYIIGEMDFEEAAPAAAAAPDEPAKEPGGAPPNGPAEGPPA